ncbi:MAG: GNAT family N-acetyltransferase [Microbacterium sp.]|uniref:GNAT family N-acetyltransferase n=1 Tax=Microbacterium sp. TaxID=51671 RepID=UPI003A853AE7
MDETPTVTRNDSAGRYEIHLGDVLAGFVEFSPAPNGELIFPHTEVDPAFKGKGLGSVLVGEAMKDAASRGDRVLPLCPFVRRYLNENTVPGLDVDWSAPSQGGSGTGA